jgi:transposase
VNGAPRANLARARAAAIFADYTPVRMLAPGIGKTQTARLWTYARDDRPFVGGAPPAALFRFSRDRRDEQAGGRMVA